MQQQSRVHNWKPGFWLTINSCVALLFKQTMESCFLLDWKLHCKRSINHYSFSSIIYNVIWSRWVNTSYTHKTSVEIFELLKMIWLSPWCEYICVMVFCSSRAQASPSMTTCSAWLSADTATNVATWILTTTLAALSGWIPCAVSFKD